MKPSVSMDRDLAAGAPAAVLRDRLRTLYEISKELIRLEGEDEAMSRVVELLAGSLPLRSIVLVSALRGTPIRTVWAAESCSAEQKQRAKDEAAEAYAYLADDITPIEDPDNHDRALPRGEGGGAESYGVRLPLAADPLHVFGVLHLESSHRLEEMDLFFVSAIVNQLGLALDSHRAHELERARDAMRRRRAEGARAAAEMSLEESEQRHLAADALREHFEALVDHLDQAFLWEADAATLSVTYISARAETLLGYPRQRWLSGDEPPGWWVHPEDWPRLTGMVRTALETGADQRCDHRCVTAAGDVRWLHTGVHVTRERDPVAVQAVSIDVTAAREEATAVREELDFASAITRGLAEGILAVDVNCRVSFMNPAAEQTLGLTREEAIGAPVRAILTILRPDGRPLSNEDSPWILAMSSGEEQASEADLLVSPGRPAFPASYAVTPLVRGGSITGAVILFHDVSERRRMEQALRKSERQFRELAQTLPQIVWTLRPDGTVDFVNDRWVEYTGLHTRDGLLPPSRWLSALHPDDRDHSRAVVIDRVGRGHDFTIEARLEGADGMFRWHLNRSTVIHDEDGEPLKLVGTWTDVEDLKRAETDAWREAAREGFLAELGAVLSRSLDPAQTAATIADAVVPALADVCFVDGRLEDGGPEDGGLERLAASTAGASDRRYDDAPAAGPPQARAAGEGAVTLVPDLASVTGDTLDEAYAALLREAGAASLMVVPLPAPGGPIGALTCLRTTPGDAYGEEDLSLMLEVANRGALALDNARLHETTRRAVRAREEVLAVVSHDLRSPLSAMLAAMDILRDEAPPDRLSVVDMIERQAGRMLRLIEDLLDFSSLDAGHVSLEQSPCAVSGLATAALEDGREHASRKNVTLVAELEAEGRFEVLCDPGRIHQALTNLLSNAIKFTPEGGRVTLRVNRQDGSARFAVTDTGPGISPQDQARVFDRFWQAAATAREGTGLGLAITREIVRGHGGSIGVESELGQGATFWFTLALAA